MEGILRETGLPPECVEIELTESVVIHSMDSTVEKMQRLRSLGVSLTIDDFGTGYSSLSYLKRMPLDALKIDRAFVQDVNVDAEDAAIVQTIIVMASNLNLEVIAEGVETAEQLHFLQERGCRLYQGNYFATPMQAQDLEAFLADMPQHKALTDIINPAT